MRSISATEMVTSPATTAPLFNTRSRVSQSETRSLGRIERFSRGCSRSVFIIVVSFGALEVVVLRADAVEAIEQLLLARVELSLGDRAGLELAMQIAQFSGDTRRVVLEFFL